MGGATVLRCTSDFLQAGTWYVHLENLRGTGPHIVRMAQNGDKDKLLPPHYSEQVLVQESDELLVQNQGSINTDRSSMFGSSYYSEGDRSFTGSTESVPTSLPNSRTPIHAYGAVALSPTGKESRVILSEFDAFPVIATCHSCRQDVTTQVRYQRGRLTWISSGVLALLFCGLCCFMIPCCVSSLKDVYHLCPNCGTTIGIYRRKASCVS